MDMNKFGCFCRKQVRLLLAKFNFRYYEDEAEYKDYQFDFTAIKTQCVAYSLEDVKKVLDFAEQYQEKGNYVALYLPYEAAPAFNSDMEVNFSKESSNIYAAAYVFDSPSKSNELHNKQSDSQTKLDFKFRLPDDMLQAHIQAVQQAIVEGNTYQVNYTTRLYDEIRLPITDLYVHLTRHAHGNYTVLLDTAELQVASISPELFFQKGRFKEQENVVLSKPMKGTMPRGHNEADDHMLYEKLMYSSKDRAENVMIVDLLRNDIARIAKPGSVKVYQPFHIEVYETVCQMTSMVVGTMKENTSLVSLFEALFPCGSITGAPKINTMRYIKQLEEIPRHVYCGTIGLLLPNGKAIFNVAIRTVQYINGRAIYGVGAGITIDSNPEAEVAEFKSKTKILEQ